MPRRPAIGLSHEADHLADKHSDKRVGTRHAETAKKQPDKNRPMLSQKIAEETRQGCGRAGGRRWGGDDRMPEQHHWTIRRTMASPSKKPERWELG